jgi:hypothetical protein
MNGKTQRAAVISSVALFLLVTHLHAVAAILGWFVIHTDESLMEVISFRVFRGSFHGFPCFIEQMHPDDEHLFAN